MLDRIHDATRLGASVWLPLCVVVTMSTGTVAQEQTTAAPHAGHAPAPPATASAPASPAKPGELPEIIKKPIALMPKALGPYTRAISSKNAEAQAFFTQGTQMMFAFAKVDAIRSFRAAWTADPDCAICYWGEAWAWGSYLNEKMDAEDAPFAYAASRTALSLKGKASPVERDYIDALAVRYVKDFDPEKRRVQDEAYAESTRRLSEKYPDDLDARTLYAEALFLLEPRKGRRDVNAPNIQRLHGVLEGILARDPKHPGACHLYVHATESTVRPDKAEACAEYLGKSIPGASHINHMPSHTWNEVGRWGDSVRSNLDAVALRHEGRHRRGLRHLPRAQPAHAAVRGVDGRAGRDRHDRGPRLRQAQQGHDVPGAHADPVRPLR